MGFLGNRVNGDMAPSVDAKLDGLHPRMLRAPSPADPQELGAQHRRELGQAFEWALDKARITKQEAAFAMGYTDSGVIGRWISGKENIQLGRVRLLGDDFLYEFVIAWAQTCGGIRTIGQTLLPHWMLRSVTVAGVRNRSKLTPRFDGFHRCRPLSRSTYLEAMEIRAANA